MIQEAPASLGGEQFTGGSYIGGNSENLNIMTGTDSNDSLVNDRVNVTVSSGDGRDTVRNYASHVAVKGGAGNDYIYNDDNVTGYIIRRSHVTVDGGEGSDYIYNYYCRDSSLSGGAGNDYIYNRAKSNNTTLDGGAGNDYLENYYGTYSSYLGKTYEASWDITFLGGDGDDTIRNYYGNRVTITGGTGDDKIYNEKKNSLAGNGGDEVIYKYALGDGNDTITGYRDANRIQISGSEYSTQKSGNDILITVGDGSILLKDFSANVLNINDETITVQSVEYSGTEDADTITNTTGGAEVNGGAGNDTINNSGSNVTVTGGDGNDSIKNTGSTATITAGAGNDTIYNTGENSTLDGGSGNDSITNHAASFVTIDGGAGNDFITNTKTRSDEYAFYVSITGGDGNDTIVNTSDWDVTLDGGTGDDLISLSSSASFNVLKYALGDGNDLIQGFNDTTTLQVDGTYSTTKSGNDVIVTVGDGKITLVGAASLNSANIVPTATKTLTLTNNSPSAMMFTSDIKNVNASARSKAINITGNAANNSIVGGKVADTLGGGSGNDTLTGSWGADIFIYTAGNDVITDYAANFDKISLAGDGAKYLSHITGVSVENNDVTLTFSKNSNKTLTLNSAANKKVIVNGATRYFAENQVISYDKKSVTLTSAFNGTFDAGTYSKVDASAVAQSVTISGGNSGGVSVVGSSKADSIVGTTGNDTMTGGYGADTFVYTGGQDVITDYAANFDRISLAGGNSAKWLSHITGVSVQNKNVTLTFSNDANKTLTLKDAAGKKVIINGATRIFEDGMICTADKKSSTVVGGLADVYWFDENNFGEPQLDSIVDTALDYSVGKLDTTDNLTKLTKDDFILTYGGK